MRKTISIAAIGLAVLSVGCNMPRPFGRPAGTMQAQRVEASRYDPYTDNDAGPEVVGGRPRDFQKPLAEPVRSRQNPPPNNGYRWLGQWLN